MRSAENQNLITNYYEMHKICFLVRFGFAKYDAEK